MCTAAESDAIDAAPPAASLGENNGNFIEPTSHTKIITSALRIGENLIAHKPQRQSPKHKSPHGCMQNTIHYLIQKCNLKACTTQGRQRTGSTRLPLQLRAMGWWRWNGATTSIICEHPARNISVIYTT
jgi:hypothetical protein